MNICHLPVRATIRRCGKEAYTGKFQEELAEDPAYAFICYIDANYVADSGIQGISERIPYLAITALVFSGIFRTGQ